LKPENILIDHEGHVKLTDFGLSKMNFTKDDISQSFCGSPEYMSPEMLSYQGHSQSLDYYCLGVLLFELLTGLPPHFNKNKIKMYQSIQSKSETYPSYLSEDVVSLLKGLLEKNPDRRIRANQIKKHPFCRDIDWTKLINKEGESAIKVDIYQSNFDD
jgi:serine/threonine protein kinase